VTTVSSARKAAAPAPSSAYGLVANFDQLAIEYTIKPAAQGFVPELVGASTRPVRLSWTAPTGQTLKSIDLLFHFDYQGWSIAISVPDVSAADGSFDLGAPLLQRLARDLLTELGKTGLVHPDRPLPETLPSVAIDIRPRSPAGPTHAVQTVRCNNQLTVQCTLKPSAK
jgi:hypothetical protein